MILVDYSQVAIANIMQFREDLKIGSSDPKAVNIIRHAILSGVKKIKKDFSNDYGEMVLACDGKHVWRRDEFEHYKADRKKNRDSSDLNWPMILDTMSVIRDEIRENFPYRVMHVDRAEGDDVIAVMTKWAVETPTDSMFLDDDGQPVLIVSSDEDFLQLQKYKSVRQYAPTKGKMLYCEDPKSHLNGHIAKAGDDGIPNVLSDPATFVTEGIRQTPMRAARWQSFKEQGREACENDTQRGRWDLNNKMVNFECIPQEITDAVISTYINNPPKGSRSRVYNYLIKNRCKMLLEKVDEF